MSDVFIQNGCLICNLDAARLLRRAPKPLQAGLANFFLRDDDVVEILACKGEEPPVMVLSERVRGIGARSRHVKNNRYLKFHTQ